MFNVYCTKINAEKYKIKRREKTHKKHTIKQK